jgi:predicted phage terminase large subunit-like protein
VQAEPNGRLDLWARDHRKSTIITFALTIQDILSSHGDDPLDHWGGREATFGFFSHTRPSAKGFLRQIKREFEQNGFLKSIFPDVLWENPESEAPQWSEDEGIVVKRKSNPKEATVEAWGLVDGQPIGKHFLVMVYDDVVTKASVNTPEMVKKTTESWELSLNLSTSGGIERYIGTRYSDADTYKTIMERKGAVPRIHPATHNGRADGDPVLLTPAELEKKRTRMGTFTFSAQMLQNPVPGDTAFFREEDFIHRFTIDELPADLNIFMASDYAVSEGEGDYTEHGIVGIDSEENFWIFDWWSGQTRADEWIDAGLDLVQKRQPLVWVGEKGVIQKAVEPFLTKRMEQRSAYCTLEWIARTQNKAAMARSFQAMASAGKVRVLQCAWGDELVAQALRFPFAANDDKVDVLALFGMILDQTWGAIAKKPQEEDPTDMWGRKFRGEDSWRTA